MIEQLHDRHRWIGEIGGLPFDHRSDSGGGEIDEVQQEDVWALIFDAVGLQHLSREVAQVLCDDDLGPRSNRCRENVTIVGVRECEAVDERFVPGDEAVRYCFAHELASASELLHGEVGATPDNGAHHLVEDLVGPNSSEQTRHTQTHEKITQPCGMQNARVVGGREGQWSEGFLVLEAEALCFGGQLARHRMAVRIITTLVSHNVSQ